MSTNKDKSVHSSHRARLKNKFLNGGLSGFSDHEIIELLLFYAIPRRDVNPLAHALINKFGSINGVIDADIESLKLVEGMGENSATLISLLHHVFNKYNSETRIKTKLDSALMAKAFCKTLFGEPNVEQFYVICLNSSNKIICKQLLSTGTSTKVNVNVRQITDFALKNKCERIIITHNHPSEHCMPSDDDLAFTRTVLCSCLLNDIDVLDHIIVSKKDASSFAELGLLNGLKKNAFDSLKLGKSVDEKLFQSKNYTN